MFWYIVFGIGLIYSIWIAIKEDWSQGLLIIIAVFLGSFMLQTFIWAIISSQNEFDYIIQEIPCAAVDYDGTWYCGFESELEAQTPDKVIKNNAVLQPYYIKQVHQLNTFWFLPWSLFQWDTYILVLPS